ncbi:MAG: hypothetical protein HOA17_09260 [Candidatus Melainabacteria bacterium]|jgi:hypothetical protein|nr:hypothetical protein [Candidatus Melainabacteria bacterium]
MVAGLLITKFIQLAGKVPTILLGAQKSDGSQINKHLPEAILDEIPGFNTREFNLADGANLKFGDVPGHEKGARRKIVLKLKQGNSFAVSAGAGNDIKTNIEEGPTNIPSRVRLQLAEGATLTAQKGKLNPGSHYPNGMRGFSDETLVTMTQNNGKLQFSLTDTNQAKMAGIDNDNSSWSDLGATA